MSEFCGLQTVDAEVNKSTAVGWRGRRKFRPQAGLSTDSRAWGQPGGSLRQQENRGEAGDPGLQGLVPPKLQTEAGSDRRLESCPLGRGWCASDLGLCRHLCLPTLGVKGVCEHVCAWLPAVNMCMYGCPSSLVLTFRNCQHMFDDNFRSSLGN